MEDWVESRERRREIEAIGEAVLGENRKRTEPAKVELDRRTLSLDIPMEEPDLLTDSELGSGENLSVMVF